MSRDAGTGAGRCVRVRLHRLCRFFSRAFGRSERGKRRLATAWATYETCGPPVRGRWRSGKPDRLCANLCPQWMRECGVPDWCGECIGPISLKYLIGPMPSSHPTNYRSFPEFCCASIHRRPPASGGCGLVALPIVRHSMVDPSVLGNECHCPVAGSRVGISPDADRLAANRARLWGFSRAAPPPPRDFYRRRPTAPWQHPLDNSLCSLQTPDRTIRLVPSPGYSECVRAIFRCVCCWAAASVTES